MNEPDTTAAEPSKSAQSLFERCLHVVTISSLTVAQPLLDLGARSAEFFVAHRFDRGDVVLLVVALVLLVPLPAVLLEVLLARAPRGVARAAHGLLVAAFTAPFWLVLLKRSAALPWWAMLALAAVAGLLAAAVYLRARWLRFFVTALAIAPVAVTVVFFASPNIRKIAAERQATFLELPPVAATAPLVMIVFDELGPAVLLDGDHQINPRRYPHLAALAQRSSWFANAVSVAETTEAALPAILTGSYPQAEKLPTLHDYPDNLFTLFGGSYDLWAQEPITELCPPELNRHQGPEVSRSGRLRGIATDVAIVYLHVILPEELAARLPSVSGTWRDFAAQRVGPLHDSGDFFVRAMAAIRSDRRDELELFTSSIGESSRPGLYFLHVLLPHRPWEFLPQGQRYPNGEHIPGLRGTTWLDDELHVRQAYQRYILQMQYVDAAIGRVVRRLEETDLFDRSLVVLLGDHGTSFRPGDTQRLISDTNAHDVVPVPLLIKAPGQRQGQVLDHPVRIIDVLPTVLDLLEIESPWEMDGRSGFDRGERTFRFVTKERGTLEIDPAIHERKYETVRWKLDLFGNGDDRLDLYRAGPAAHLVGQRSGELPRRGPTPWTVRLDGGERFQAVSLGDGIPVLVSGTVFGPETEPCCRLALALDGTVYATTRTDTQAGAERRFTAVVPDFAFREGANQIEVFSIPEDGDGLVPLPAAP